MNFDQYYQEIYRDQWPKIKAGLLTPENQMIRNCFNAPPASSPELIHGQPLYKTELKGFPYQKSESGLKQYYIMDPASYFAASMLPIEAEDKVLDMCAAPGGKSLILAEKLTYGELWSNEPSKSRRDRLIQVIRDYIPHDQRSRVFVKGKDAIKYGIQHPEEFDNILLDAPCSSERHLLKNSKELAKWTPKRTKKLSGIQYGLLCSALLAVKNGGHIMYSTCSLSPLENDLVVEKLLKKKGDQFEVIQLNHDAFSATKHGLIALPHEQGIGPIYCCLIQKNRA